MTPNVVQFTHPDFPDITAEKMRAHISNLEANPLYSHFLYTVLEWIGKARGRSESSIALANIRSLTYLRLGKLCGGKVTDAQRKMEAQSILDAEYTYTHLSGSGEIIRNSRRWTPYMMRAAVTHMCDNDLKQRGFTAEVVERKSKVQAPYNVLHISW